MTIIDADTGEVLSDTGIVPASNGSMKSYQSKVVVHRTGLEFVEPLTREESDELEHDLEFAESGVQWWRGDKLNHDEAQWGKKYTETQEESGKDYQTLRNYAWVARCIDLSRRRDKLSWSHHAEVASLSPDEQDILLDRAEKAGWSRNRLRGEVAAFQQRQLIEAVEEAEAPLPADVQPGEWWALGEHRLYCGDTSDPAFVEQAPDAAFAFADPPYNAGAAEWDNDFNWRHDWLIESAPIVAVTPGISSIFDFARITSMPYRWSVASWIDNGMTRGAMGFGNWIYIAMFATESLHRHAQDVIRISIMSEESGETNHKGRKPTQLLSRLLDLYTKEGQTVIDPFLGSGQTLLVAERMGRVCFGGEIDPSACGEIVARWEQMTGRRARRDLA